MYLLVRVGTRSRRAAWLCAAAAALMSPSFVFLTPMRRGSWMLMPLRLGVMVKYGEGPHMTALAFIPIALAFSWLALETRRLAPIAFAAVACGAVVSNNFYGATALAIFYPVLVWSFWITREDRRIFAPAIAVPLLGYGLTAFWLVPSYFKVTAENMKYVSEHGTTWSIWIAVVAAVAYAVTTDRFARGKTGRTWGVFTTGCVLFFSLNVLGNYYIHFRVAGEPGRLVPELDLVYILGASALLLWLWEQTGRAARVAVAAVIAGAFATTVGYVRHAWHIYALWPDYQSRVEYRITDWLAKNMPEVRAYPTGSVRFWFDAWHDLAHLGGSSDQGLLNGEVEPAQWETILGSNAEPSVLWLQAMGVDAAYVADKRSQEIFKDYQFPKKFEGVLPVIYDNHEGDTIYRVPRRYASRARVVDTQKLNGLEAASIQQRCRISARLCRRDRERS